MNTSGHLIKSRYNRRLIGLLFLFSALNSLAQPKESDAEKTAIESSVYWLDIDYVGDHVVGHRLDIHLPKNGKPPFPAMIVIYGSAFFSNSSKGVVFGDGFGQNRFVRANSEKFSLDNAFIGITGWSSGGHLSALAATTNSTKTYKLNGVTVDLEGSLGNFTRTSSHVDAVVDWFGPTDFLIMDKCGSTMSHDDIKSPESTLIGGAIQENPNKAALANPATYVNKENPPFLIFHGNKDPLVPLCQSERLFEKLQESGVQSEFVVIPGGGHGPGVLVDINFEKAVLFLKHEAGKLKR
jgi:dienelactone hydrolase